jgi:DNA-binding SARP family transcriptional activator/tetratricopeptide (TPR) repeat protein
MKFAVLGALQVFRDDGKAVPVRPGKVQRILAVLLSRASSPVAISELVDALWPANPPPSAVKTTRINVTRLRQDLGEAHRILCGPAGYAIAIAPRELDAQIFVERVEQAGKAKRAGDVNLAAEYIDQALSLWRGTPYGGLEDCTQLRPEVEWLNELRLQAEEERAEIALARGRHGELLPELSALVAQHPYRERPAGQLMLALYRSGRQSEALQVYRSSRTFLVEQLAVEPDRSLTDLHEAILRRDPALDLALDVGLEPDRPASRASTRLPPMEVPADLKSFTGRVDETATIAALLREAAAGSTAIVAVAGAGGIGKSALAVHVAHVVSGHFPDGVLYVNLHGATPGLEPLPSGEVLGRLLRSLGLSETQIPDGIDEAATRFRTLTARLRILVVLDDAADTSQVRPLLPGGSGNAVLVTSRRVLATLDGARHIHLDALSEPDALDLLGRLIDRERIRDQAVEARAIVRYCGRIPLAVRVAGARLAARPDWSLASFVDRLADTRRRLDELRYADLEVRSSFSISLAGLDAKARRMFELLGLLEVEHTTAPLAAAIGHVTVDEAQASLEELVGAQLLEPYARERYALHDLTRLYAHDEAIASLTEPERLQAIRRGLLHYVGTARNALRVLATMTEPRLTAGVAPDQITVPVTEFKSRAEAARWVDTETANLLSAAKQAAGLGNHSDIVIGLAAAATTLFRMRHPAGEVTVNRLAVEAAQQLGDQPGLAQAYNDLASGALSVGRVNDALSCAEQALALWRRTDFRTGEAQTLNLLGIIFDRKGDSDQALTMYSQALGLRRDLGHRESQAAVLTNIGQLLRERGELDEALRRLDEALLLYRAERSLAGEAFTLGTIGKTHQLLGQLEQSVAELEHAVGLAVETAQRPFAAEFRWYLGESLYALGRRAEASAHWQDVIAELRDIGVLTAAEADSLLDEDEPPMPEWLR